MEILNQLPPNSREAERGLLGSIMRENSVMADVADLITAESFYHHAHCLVYRVALELQTRSEPIDMVTIGTVLKDRKQLEDIGGPAYLVDLWECAPTAANALHYAEIVREKSDLRNLIHAATGILRSAYSQTDHADVIIADAQRDIMSIGLTTKRTENHKLASVLREVSDDIDRRAASPHEIIGVPSGLTELDALTGGFKPGELVIIAARPSVGKTAMATTIIRNAASTDKHALIFSLEQSRIEIGQRLLCSESGVNSALLRGCGRGNRLPSDKISKLMDASGRLTLLPIWINDTPSQRAHQIKASARRLLQHERLDVIVVDYMQLVQHDGDRGSTLTERVANTSRQLKLTARELGVSVVCLSQLSRKCEDERRRPRLSDLRDSGAIEQDADCVIFLHRPRERDDEPTEPIEAIVAKQRNGPCSEVTLTYRKSLMRFEDLNLQL